MSRWSVCSHSCKLYSIHDGIHWFRKIRDTTSGRFCGVCHGVVSCSTDCHSCGHFGKIWKYAPALKNRLQTRNRCAKATVLSEAHHWRLLSVVIPSPLRSFRRCKQCLKSNIYYCSEVEALLLKGIEKFPFFHHFSRRSESRNKTTTLESRVGLFRNFVTKTLFWLYWKTGLSSTALEIVQETVLCC